VALAEKAPGVHRMRVNREDWTVTVWFDPALTDVTKLELALEDAAEAVNASEQP